MKLEYTKQDLIECEEDAFKRGYEIGFKKGQIVVYEKTTKATKELKALIKNVKRESEVK